MRLWFSGHFHLSQNYADSISVVGSCAFVQTGVIGECNRDGSRCVCVRGPARPLRPSVDSSIYALCLVSLRHARQFAHSPVFHMTCRRPAAGCGRLAAMGF